MRLRVVLAIGALGVGALGCGDSSSPLHTDPPVVLKLVPDNAAVRVGDTTQIMAVITGGSRTLPPIVGACTSASPTKAAASVIASGCRVVGVSAGTIDVIVMASTGNSLTATVMVEAR